MRLLPTGNFGFNPGKPKPVLPTQVQQKPDAQSEKPSGFRKYAGDALVFVAVGATMFGLGWAASRLLGGSATDTASGSDSEARPCFPDEAPVGLSQSRSRRDVGNANRLVVPEGGYGINVNGTSFGDLPGHGRPSLAKVGDKVALVSQNGNGNSTLTVYGPNQQIIGTINDIQGNTPKVSGAGSSFLVTSAHSGATNIELLQLDEANVQRIASVLFTQPTPLSLPKISTPYDFLNGTLKAIMTCRSGNDVLILEVTAHEGEITLSSPVSVMGDFPAGAFQGVINPVITNVGDKVVVGYRLLPAQMGFTVLDRLDYTSRSSTPVENPAGQSLTPSEIIPIGTHSIGGIGVDISDLSDVSKLPALFFKMSLDGEDLDPSSFRQTPTLADIARVSVCSVENGGVMVGQETTPDGPRLLAAVIFENPANITVTPVGRFGTIPGLSFDWPTCVNTQGNDIVVAGEVLSGVSLLKGALISPAEYYTSPDPSEICPAAGYTNLGPLSGSTILGLLSPSQVMGLIQSMDASTLSQLFSPSQIEVFKGLYGAEASSSGSSAQIPVIIGTAIGSGVLFLVVGFFCGRRTAPRSSGQVFAAGNLPPAVMALHDLPFGSRSAYDSVDNDAAETDVDTGTRPPAPLPAGHGVTPKPAALYDEVGGGEGGGTLNAAPPEDPYANADEFGMEGDKKPKETLRRQPKRKSGEPSGSAAAAGQATYAAVRDVTLVTSDDFDPEHTIVEIVGSTRVNYHRVEGFGLVGIEGSATPAEALYSSPTPISTAPPSVAPFLRLPQDTPPKEGSIITSRENGTEWQVGGMVGDPPRQSLTHLASKTQWLCDSNKPTIKVGDGVIPSRELLTTLGTGGPNGAEIDLSTISFQASALGLYAALSANTKLFVGFNSKKELTPQFVGWRKDSNTYTAPGGELFRAPVQFKPEPDGISHINKLIGPDIRVYDVNPKNGELTSPDGIVYIPTKAGLFNKTDGKFYSFRSKNQYDLTPLTPVNDLPFEHVNDARVKLAGVEFDVRPEGLVHNHVAYQLNDFGMHTEDGQMLTVMGERIVPLDGFKYNKDSHQYRMQYGDKTLELTPEYEGRSIVLNLISRHEVKHRFKLLLPSPEGDLKGACLSSVTPLKISGGETIKGNVLLFPSKDGLILANPDRTRMMGEGFFHAIDTRDYNLIAYEGVIYDEPHFDEDEGGPAAGAPPRSSRQAVKGRKPDDEGTNYATLDLGALATAGGTGDGNPEANA